MSFDHRAIEKKWQARWQSERLYRTEDAARGTENEYLLVEYPYPSGNLHIGHWYAFAVPDIYARFRRMQGKNVLFPMGFDSFGLPAENAAIKRGLDPKAWTYDNIAHMTTQLESMGNSFDWSRRVVASDPEYYRFTQWLFLKLYEAGLAYKKSGPVPWCDSCKTVLANEQIVNGACERCSTVVVQKELSQWYLKITDYAERLLSDLETLDWPEEIKAAQREWIGKSAGALLKFKVQSEKCKDGAHNNDCTIEVFTTRADTLYGATYLVLAPEHPLVATLKQETENEKEIDAYVEKTRVKKELERKEGKEKTGVELKGVKAVNPGTGEEIPIWIADYVLGSYGTGAIMAVPAHDERDYAFASRMNAERTRNGAEPQLAIRQVIFPTAHISLRQKGGFALMENDIERKLKDNFHVDVIDDEIHITGGDLGVFKEISDSLGRPDLTISDDESTFLDVWNAIDNGETYLPFTKEGILVTKATNSIPKVFNRVASADAKTKITEHVGGTLTTQYRLRDWLLSRQRYWGCPIPIVYDPEGKPHTVPDEHLPWKLPTDVDFKPTGEAPLAKSKELRERTERIFGTGWKPEVDTMDTFVDSSWYFLRYLDPTNEHEFCSLEKQRAWMPVALYSGGAEHTTMHLLYSRFFYKALFDLGLVTEPEPYRRRMNRGLILGPDGAKMSKSKGNVIDPDENVERVGADTVKMYLAFIGPYNEPGQYPWDLGGIAGVRRFLERVWRLHTHVGGTEKQVERAESDSEIRSSSQPATNNSLLLFQTIKKVGEDIAALKFNTAISSLMTFVNHLEKQDTVSVWEYETLIRLLAPFAPHLTEEIWEALGHTTSVHREEWPLVDESVLAQAQVTVAVQIDGKTRATFTAARDLPDALLTAQARNAPGIADRLAERTVLREVAVPNRLVNFVTKARDQHEGSVGKKLDAS